MARKKRRSGALAFLNAMLTLLILGILVAGGALFWGITQYYDQALKTQFSKVLPLASSPNSQTLVVRPAITAVSASTKGLRPYEVIPIALVAAGVSASSKARSRAWWYRSASTRYPLDDARTERRISRERRTDAS